MGALVNEKKTGKYPRPKGGQENSNLCTKCGAAWSGETGKYPCPKGGKCDIPAARAIATK